MSQKRRDFLKTVGVGAGSAAAGAAVTLGGQAEAFLGGKNT